MNTTFWIAWGCVAVCFLALLYALLTWLERCEAKKPHLPGSQAIFTTDEATALIALKRRVEAERYTTGAEYDSTC